MTRKTRYGYPISPKERMGIGAGAIGLGIMLTIAIILVITQIT
jgi:hypothetical protein